MSGKNSWQSANGAVADNGSLGISYALDFTEGAAINGDLTYEMLDGKIAFLQSIYIDNADNSATMDLILYGAPVPLRIRAQPYTQGWYPLAYPIGSGRFMARSQAGVVVNAIFSNFMMPYTTWGPADGALVVPATVNVGLSPLALAAGDNVLVAGQPGETVRLYKAMFEPDAAVTFKLTDGPGGAVLFSALLAQNGSATLQGSGVPWAATTPGNSLVVNVNDPCNLYGVYGYAQD